MIRQSHGQIIIVPDAGHSVLSAACDDFVDDNPSAAVGCCSSCPSTSNDSSSYSGTTATHSGLASSTTKQTKRNKGKCLVPSAESTSEIENELFSKWLQSDITKNDAITGMVELKKIKLELEIEQLKRQGGIISEP